MDERILKVLAVSLGNLVGQAVLATKMGSSGSLDPIAYCKDLMESTTKAYGLSSEDEDLLFEMVEEETQKFINKVGNEVANLMEAK